MKIKFRSKPATDKDGRRFVVPPARINEHHFCELCNDWCRRKALWMANKKGIIPKIIYLDDLPKNATLKDTGFLVTVTLDLAPAEGEGK